MGPCESWAYAKEVDHRGGMQCEGGMQKHGGEGGHAGDVRGREPGVGALGLCIVLGLCAGLGHSRPSMG